MSEEERPIDPKTGEPFAGIVMTHQRAVCPLYGEPFRADYPRGFLVFQVKAFQAVTAVRGIWEEANEIAGVPRDADHDVRRMEAVFDRKPICCRLPKPQLVALYKECLGAVNLAPRRRCSGCGEKRAGTPYRVMTPLGVQEIDHMCFDCVVYHMVSTRS